MNYELQKQENIIVFDMILNLKLYQVVWCPQDPLSKLICPQDDWICWEPWVWTYYWCKVNCLKFSTFSTYPIIFSAWDPMENCLGDIKSFMLCRL
jgi:hypothetical protein